MKPREPRRKVFVAARLRADGRWSDVRVLDVASRGFLIQAHEPPPRGTYIELCRGRLSIVARVVWTRQQRFGVRTQDKVPVDAFVDPSDATDAPRTKFAAGQEVERRSRHRREHLAARQDANRYRARALEFCSLAACGGAAVFMLLGLVQQFFTRSLASVAGALGG